MADRIIDWLFGVITGPVRTLNEIAREKPVTWALLIFFGITVLTAAVSLYGGQAYEHIEEAMLLLNIALPLQLLLVYSIISSILSLFIVTAVLHLFARLLKGTGGYRNLFSAYAFANFPMIITVPVTVITALIGPFGSFINGLVTFSVSIWVLCLQVIAVRESHNLTTGQSILVFIIPLVLVIVAVIALAIALLMPVFAGM